MTENTTPETPSDSDSPVVEETVATEEAPPAPTAAPAAADKKSAGSEVVKVSKARKLVAAGTAEDVEIQAELENNAPAAEETQTPESAE